MIPTVSIAMSTYNGEAYIQEQIESILKQKFVDVHIHIRDDGSTDNTVSIINDYATRYPNKITTE